MIRKIANRKSAIENNKMPPQMPYLIGIY